MTKQKMQIPTSIVQAVGYAAAARGQASKRYDRTVKYRICGVDDEILYEAQQMYPRKSTYETCALANHEYGVHAFELTLCT